MHFWKIVSRLSDEIDRGKEGCIKINFIIIIMRMNI